MLLNWGMRWCGLSNHLCSFCNQWNNNECFLSLHPSCPHHNHHNHHLDKYCSPLTIFEGYPNSKVINVCLKYISSLILKNYYIFCKKNIVLKSFLCFAWLFSIPAQTLEIYLVTRQICLHGDTGHRMMENINSPKINFC